MADETPQEQFDRYKKELGKQYMDGLISDTEYDEMLHAKETELGLNQPVIAEESEGLECPSCGALISEYDTECSICGIALEPVMPSETPDETPEQIDIPIDAPPIPEDELGLDGPSSRTCPSCGAEVSEADTVCSMCGNVLIGQEPALETEPAEMAAEISEIMDEEPPGEERVCPSCGAFVPADATECMICETPLDFAASPEPGIPSEEEEMPVDAAPPGDLDTAPTDDDIMELVCSGCGAILDADATECFICGQLVGETVVPEKMAHEPETIDIVDEIKEPIPEEPVEEDIIESYDELPPMEEESADELPEITSIEDDMAEISDELPPVEEASDAPLPLEDELDQEMRTLQEEVPEAEIVEEIILHEGEMICPSCSSVIPDDSDKCPECWTDFSLYVRCPACGMLTPSGEDTCRECFAPLDVPMEVTSEGYVPADFEATPLDIEIPEEMEISEELMEEMTYLETEEEQGKECLVCGAVFGPDDEVCPICFMEYGVEIDEPEMIDYESWDTMEVIVAPTVYICPNCGENMTGMDASEREINEGRWFYRGIISIFIGIFFTSFSIWARGISAENSSLGMNPPPTDVLLNVIGWILVLIGFVFWFFSWKLHEEKVECPQCGIEVNPDMANCINCGSDLTDGEQYIEDEYVEEQYPDEIPGEYADEAEESLEVPTEFDEPLEVPAEFDEPLEVPAEFDEPLSEEDVYETDIANVEEPASADQELEIPEDVVEEPVKEPVEKYLDEPLEEDVPEPVIEEPEVAVPEPQPEISEGDDLSVKHEEHIQCPGCGIFVDANATICPVCDTVFDAAPAVQETVHDSEIDIMSEEEEMAGLGVEVEPETEPLEQDMEITDVQPETVDAVDEITVPEEDAEHIECPSCGADLVAGTKVCPVCEYPLE